MRPRHMREDCRQALLWRSMRVASASENQARTGPISERADINSCGSLVPIAPWARARTFCGARDLRARQMLQPFGGYLQSASDAFACELIIHSPSELVGDEVLDHGRAISVGIGCTDRWSACLLPFEDQFTPRVTVGVPAPAYRYPAMPAGKGTILRGIGSELVQNHRHGLCRLRREHNVGAID